MKPIREFTANVGEASVGLGGPDQIEKDIDKLMTMMDPAKTHNGGESGGLKAENFNPAAATDPVVGPRTADQAIADAPADTGTLTQLFGWVAKLIKGITGKADWKTAPAKTLEQLAAETTTLIADLNTEEAALVAHKSSADHDGRYLAKGNTDPYNPSLPYEPCTVKLLNDTAAGISQGAVADGSITDIKLHADNKVGSLAALTTTVKTSVVAAINAVVSTIGSLGSLLTTEKASLVGAINELYNRPTEPLDGSVTNAKLATDVKVGSLASLQTTEKGSVVGAINELKNSTPAGAITETSVSSLSNKTMVAMKVTSAGRIDDASGNELFEFPATVTSAVNQVKVSNAATGSGPKLEASGGDTNIDLSIGGKGTGAVKTLTQPLTSTCLRNITISTSSPSGGTAGDIWLKY